MVARIWRGCTTPSSADSYEALLKGEVFVGIQGRGVELYRRDLGPEVEFVTVMLFDSLDAVKSFAGRTMRRPSSRRRQGRC